MTSAPLSSSSYIVKSIRLLVPSNKAKPSPAIGQSLGSIGLNMMKFCKEFNSLSVNYVDDIPLRVKLHSYNDGQSSFTFHLPQSSFFLKKLSLIPRGADEPTHEIVGAVHVKQLFELAKLKQNDSEHLRGIPLKSIFSSLVNQCKSIGIFVDFADDQIIAARERFIKVRDEQTRKKLKLLEEENNE